MKLFELFRKETTTPPYKLSIMAAIAGLSNAAVLGIINAAAAQAAQNIHQFRFVLYFLIAVALYATTQAFVMVTTSREVETVLHRVRVRIAERVLRSELITMERVGHSVIYASITKETLTISNTATALSIGIQTAILVFFASLYIAYLSLTAFVVSAVFVVIAASIHLRKRKELQENLQRTAASENLLFDTLTDMLAGFKEMKINRALGAGLFQRLGRVSQQTADIKIRTQSDMAGHIIFSQVTFLMLLGTMVFIVPRLTPIQGDSVVQLTASVLFLIGPITSLVSIIPTVAVANSAAENIYALEATLAEQASPPDLQGAQRLGFKRIEFDRATFRYMDASGGTPFVVGPLDLEIRAQEVLFIIGGNGSGKSTFLKLLTALYLPSSGEIRVDGVRLEPKNVNEYRSLFTAIFSDYHLFKRLYGFADVDHQRIDELLQLMEMENKTRLVDHEFETVDLSAGQRKRLALLVSFLEDKPVYVFDEWAADQDPGFLRKFYEQLLLQLRQRGKTVIAVTHDDKYFGAADRCIKMEEGRFVGTVAVPPRGAAADPHPV
jgi:putative ATP-binding cassette transporter